MSMRLEVHTMESDHEDLDKTEPKSITKEIQGEDAIVLKELKRIEWMKSKKSWYWCAAEAYSDTLEQHLSIVCIYCRKVFNVKRIPSESSWNWTDIQTRFRVHVVEHFKGTKIEFPDENAKKSTCDQEKLKPIDVALQILQSGMAYKAFVRGAFKGFLEKNGFPILHEKNFRRIAIDLACTSVELIIQSLKSSKVHLTFDASPDKRGNEFVSFTFYLLNKDLEFEIIPLGLFRAIGSMKQENYDDHIRRILCACDFQYPEYPGDFMDSSSAVISSTTDAGGGGHPAAKSIWGSYHTTCICHGLQNIVDFSLKHWEPVWNQVSKATKYLRLRQNIEKLGKLSIGLGTGSTSRWGRKIQRVEYFSNYWDQIIDVVGDSIEITPKKRQFSSSDDSENESESNLLKVTFSELGKKCMILHGILSPLKFMMKMAQHRIPGQTYVFVYYLLETISKYNKSNFLFEISKKEAAELGSTRNTTKTSRDLDIDSLGIYNEYSNLRSTILTRLLGRFFEGSFSTLSGSKANISSRVHTEGLFKNPLILVTFGLSSGAYDFEFLYDLGLATKDECYLIFKEANTSVVAMYKKFISNDEIITEKNVFIDSSHSTTVDDVPSFLSRDVTHKPNNQISDAEILIKRDTLVKDPELHGIFKTFFLDKTTCIKDKAQILTKEWIRIAQKRDQIFGEMLKICLSKPLSSVADESNFGCMQHLESGKRTNMSTPILAAYFHGMKNDSVFKRAVEVIKRKDQMDLECENNTTETRQGKISSKKANALLDARTQTTLNILTTGSGTPILGTNTKAPQSVENSSLRISKRIRDKPEKYFEIMKLAIQLEEIKDDDHDIDNVSFSRKYYSAFKRKEKEKEIQQRQILSEPSSDTESDEINERNCRYE